MHKRAESGHVSVRQFVTIHILLPMGRALGIKGGKIMRFMERMYYSTPQTFQKAERNLGTEGYAVFYFGIMGTIGVVSFFDC